MGHTTPHTSLKLTGTDPAADSLPGEPASDWRDRLKSAGQQSGASAGSLGLSRDDLKVDPLDHQPASDSFAVDMSDPRWILACRVGELLEGQTLRPHRREQLIRLAKLMELTPFAAQLVIAAVQDQARRGIPSSQCAAAAVRELMLVPMPPSKRRPWRWSRIAMVAFTLLALELTLGMVLLGRFLGG